MIFSYWTGETTTPPPFVDAWKAIDPSAVLYDDRTVADIIKKRHPYIFDIWRRIRIPACKGDLSRLLLLEHFGGFFLDVHAVPGDEDSVTALVRKLDDVDLVLFLSRPASKREIFYLLNGAIVGRKHTRIMTLLIRGLFKNLVSHFLLERSSKDHVDYNIAALTGGWALGELLFHLGVGKWSLRAPYITRVRIEHVEEHTPHHPAFSWHQNYRYRLEGQHWSERQNSEPLFEVE